MEENNLSRNAVSSIEALEKEFETTKKKVKKNLLIVFVFVLVFLVTGILFIARKIDNHEYKYLDDILSKILGVGLIVFFIELILHWLFERMNRLKIHMLLAKSLHLNQLITDKTLSEKSEEITNNLDNTSLVLTQKSSEILLQLKQNITANKDINDSGIRGLKEFKSIIDFLKESLDNYKKNNTDAKASPSQINVKVLMLFIGELQEKHHDGQHRREEFERLVKEILTNDNSVEIILPNYKSAKISEFLKLRGKSFNAQDRIKQVKNTCDNLIRLKESGEVYERLTLKFHEEFIGFPLWGCNQTWYQGSYLCANYAENTKFIEYTSETPINEIGNKLDIHFQAISNGSLSLDEFKIYQPYLFYNAGEFLNSLFVSQKEENLTFKFSLGKSYCFFAHAAYKESKDSTKSHTHYLSKSLIKIIGNFQDNCYKATFSVRTFENGKEVDLIYKGVIAIDKLSNNLHMVFNDDHNNAAAPIIISGGIPDSKNKELLILHHTFKSHQRNSTTTNIGILSLFGQEESETPELQDIRVGSEINADPQQLLVNQAKLFLMRKNKVSIKTPKFHNERNEVTEIFNREQIQKFFRIRYKGIEEHAGKYSLYYSKSNIVLPAQISEFGRADLNIFDNGIVELNLVSIDEAGKESFEVYFGDMNFQQTDTTNPVVSIKFIRSLKEEDSVMGSPTCYRELFLVLFWDRGEYSKYFEITRGILLGDRDKNLGNNQQWRDNFPIIESNQCVLVNKDLFEKRTDKVEILRQALKRETRIRLTGEQSITLNEDNRGFIIIQYNDELYKFDHLLKKVSSKEDGKSTLGYSSIH